MKKKTNKNKKNMEKFIALHVSNLRLDDLAGLATETFEIANPRVAALGDVGAAKLTALKTATDTFLPLLHLNRASDLTPNIVTMDKQRDAAFREIKRTTKAAQSSSAPATRTAANTLMEVLKPFWNISAEHIASQTAQITLFVSRCTGSVATAITTLGLSNAFTALQGINSGLKSAYNSRLNEMSALDGASASAAAKDVVAAYDNFCTAVEVTLSALPTDTLQLVFNNMNDVRIKYISRLPTPLDDKRTSTAPVPAQVYTGRHLTPIPRVFHQTADGTLTELVFAEDFTVSYRNNVEVGEAKLFIHGKGHYTGTYTTTFHIIES
jgi:hypothetical protein